MAAASAHAVTPRRSPSRRKSPRNPTDIVNEDDWRHILGYLGDEHAAVSRVSHMFNRLMGHQDNNADCDVCVHDGRHALVNAVSRNHYNCVRHLLARYPAQRLFIGPDAPPLSLAHARSLDVLRLLHQSDLLPGFDTLFPYSIPRPGQEPLILMKPVFAHLVRSNYVTMDMIQYAVTEGGAHWTPSILKWMLTGFPQWPAETVFDIVQYAHACGCAWIDADSPDSNVCTAAVEVGCVPMLDWARANGCPWSVHGDEFVYVKSTEAFKALIALEAPIPAAYRIGTALMSLVGRENNDRIMASNVHALRDYVASRHDGVRVLTEAARNAIVCKTAAMRNLPLTLAALHESNFVMDESTTREAVAVRSRACFEYAMKNGCPIARQTADQVYHALGKQAAIELQHWIDRGQVVIREADGGEVAIGYRVPGAHW